MKPYTSSTSIWLPRYLISNNHEIYVLWKLDVPFFYGKFCLLGTHAVPEIQNWIGAEEHLVASHPHMSIYQGSDVNSSELFYFVKTWCFICFGKVIFLGNMESVTVLTRHKSPYGFGYISEILLEIIIKTTYSESLMLYSVAVILSALGHI